MISLGQLEDSSPMSSEHSSIVTEVGLNLQNQFPVGDRICAWGGNAYSNSIRVNSLEAHRIPHEMSFETAASIPIVYITAYYALDHLARLRKGESVLIHSVRIPRPISSLFKQTGSTETSRAPPERTALT